MIEIIRRTLKVKLPSERVSLSKLHLLEWRTQKKTRVRGIDQNNPARLGKNHNKESVL